MDSSRGETHAEADKPSAYVSEIGIIEHQHTLMVSIGAGGGILREKRGGMLKVDMARCAGFSFACVKFDSMCPDNTGHRALSFRREFGLSVYSKSLYARMTDIRDETH